MPAYAVLLYTNTDRDPADEKPGDRDEHRVYADELVAEGQMVLAAALEDPSVATSIRAGSMIDGPFLETKEVLLGFYVLEAADLDDAISVARRNPILHQGGGVEVRPVEEYGQWPQVTPQG
jgi:hypothetical protein